MCFTLIIDYSPAVIRILGIILYSCYAYESAWFLLVECLKIIYTSQAFNWHYYIINSPILLSKNYKSIYRYVCLIY